MTQPPATDAAQARARRPRQRRPAFIVVLLGTAAALAVLLGGCGGSAAGSGSGQPGQDSPSPESSPGGAVAFAQCMRSHGVTDFPDPQNGHFLISGNDRNNPNFNSAVQACQHLLGPNGVNGGGGSNNSQLLAFAHCMQTHGVPKFPDPTAGGGIGLPPGVDPNSPGFQKAWQECQSKLPGNLQGQQP